MNLTPVEELAPLTPQAFYVLLALADKPMYGYGVQEQCELDVDNELHFDKGSIYRTLHGLRKMGLIEMTEEIYGTSSPHSRKYYSLTKTGQMVLQFEADRYTKGGTLAQQRLAALTRKTS